MAIRLPYSVRKAVASAAVTFLLLTGATKSAPADDVSQARHELVTAEDYRVRVNAALVLGRMHPQGAREALEHSLADTHPAVRAAAAAALGTLGDPQAIGPLERAAAPETAQAARAQMRLAADALRKVSASLGAKYVLELGNMRNNTSTRGSQLGYVLHDAAAARAASLPGVVLAEGPEREKTLRMAAQKSLPVLTLDGSLTGLTQAKTTSTVSFRAQVMFAIRKEQTLKASLTGAATSSDGVAALTNQARVVELQNDAVDGAVQSAMRGVPSGITIASAN